MSHDTKGIEQILNHLFSASQMSVTGGFVSWYATNTYAPIVSTSEPAVSLAPDRPSDEQKGVNIHEDCVVH